MYTRHNKVKSISALWFPHSALVVCISESLLREVPLYYPLTASHRSGSLGLAYLNTPTVDTGTMGLKYL